MRHVRNLLFAVAVAVPLLAQSAEPALEIWTADKVHSSTEFRIRHLMSNVPGKFRDFDATVAIDRANPARSTVEFNIRSASIDTGDASRDEHLRSPDFFESAKYPTISFKSEKVVAKTDKTFDVSGNLTMHGVTKKVTLPVTFNGFMNDGRNDRAGFEIATTLDRKDYGITWNRILDEGGVLLGDEVKVQIELQLIKKK